ncbi:MAG: hypothetical protein CVU45_08405, partial [Chloroflexi bacterium HGW-Chloroflexi-7]
MAASEFMYLIISKHHYNYLMKTTATKTLPERYILARTLDLRQTRNLILVNLFGLILLIVSWIGYT